MLARRTQHLFTPLGAAAPFIRSVSHHAGPPNRPGLRRGGQNLSNRYRRLEKSLRGKQEFTHEIEEFDKISDTTLAKAAPLSEDTTTPATLFPSSVPLADTFHGFKIPKEPKPPADDECCMSGCAICVYDLYDESLEEYRKSISTLRASLTSMGIPQTEWPKTLREFGSPAAAPARKSTQEVTLNAFEQMEKALAAKKTPQAKQVDAIDLRGKNTASMPVQASAGATTDLSRARRRNAIPPPPPPTFRDKVTELAEGIRWVLFSNR